MSKVHNRSDILVVGPRAPAIGGIATYVETMLEHIPTYHFDTPPVNGLFRKLMRFVRGVAAIFVHRRYCSILHLHSAYGISFYEKAVYAQVGRWLGYRTILHIHAGRFEEFVEKSRLKRWIRYNLESADAVIALSSSWADYLTKVAPDGTIVTIENAVPVPAAPVPVNDTPVVLLLGAINDRKGVPEAISAFARVVRQHPSAELWLAGPSENGDLIRYQDLASRLGVSDSIHFLGAIRGDAKAHVLKNCNVFILPSHAEGLPIALLEAMATGRPVIVTRVGGIPDVITEGREGFLISPGDVETLADRICRLLDSTSLRVEMGFRAWQTVHERFDICVMVERLRRLYDELAAQIHMEPSP